MLSSYGVEHISHSWSCLARPKGYLINYLLSVLLLFRAQLETVLLSGCLRERTHKLTVTQNVKSPENPLWLGKLAFLFC